MISSSQATTLDTTGCQDEVLLNQWHAVAALDEVKADELSPIRLLERDLVAWRDSKGDIHVWEDLCVHRGARLSKGFIARDRVVCPYHGWNYDGSGQCVFMPASPKETPMKKAKTIVHRVKEQYGLVWVCLGTPTTDIPGFTEWNDPSFKKVICGPYAFKSSYRAVENFLDITHFPFVHAGLNGSPDDPDPIPPYDVSEDHDGLYSTEIRVHQPLGDPREVPVFASYSYRAMRPFVAYFQKRLEISDPARASEGSPDDRFSTFMAVQPIDEVTSLVRIICAMNFAKQPTDEAVRQRQALVYSQDGAIVDTQRPERIPVDLRYELHHRSDLMGQRYRSWLKRQGVTYGTFGTF
jgi:phenylpropionate dioxygenase-like ring-hydroxylating dioxygenase large terminal subunit